MIHITDSQTDRILDVIDEEEFWDDKHYKSLKDTLETFDFVTFANKRFSEHLTKRNRIIIPDEDGEYIEFIIENTRKFHSADGFFVEVYTSASYIELAKAKVIEPQTTPAWTAKQHAEMALSDTEWEIGTVDFAGSRTITIESYTNPYSYLKQVANEFGLELHFRVETDSNKVTRRYVDLIEHVGGWYGREVEFGKDLIGIERKEDFSNIVTALVGIGPERDDSTRLEVFVEDKDALARWGRNGKHIVDVYEPNSSDSNMTLEQLRSLTEAELAKRINSAIEYTGDVVDLEKVPGLEHEKFRLGDTIRIKDMAFIPPLYLEARVHTIERSIKKNGYKTVTLGDYIEYTEEEVMAIWKSLQAEIAKKVSLTEVKEVVYTKQEVDEKDNTVKEEAAQDATNKANQAEENSKQYVDVREVYIKEYADQQAQQAEQMAVTQAESIAEQKKQLAIQQAIAEAETKINAAKEDVQGQIDGLGSRMTTAETSISQLSNQIALKANQSTVDTLTGQVSSLQAQLTVQAGQIATKVEKNGVISAINQTAEQIKIQASKVDLAGYVTFTNLSTPGQTTIDGGNLKTGSITADKIAAKAITADKLNVTSLDAISADLGTIEAGTIKGVNIEGAQITQTGNTGSILLTNEGLIVRDASAKRRIGIFTSNTNFQGFSASAITFEPNTDEQFYVGTGLHGLGDGFIGFSKDVSYPRSLIIRNNAFTSNPTDSKIGLWSPKVEISGNILKFGSGPYIDTYGGTLRLKQSDGNYIHQNEYGDVIIYANGSIRHRFNGNGTKSGGSIEIGGQILGMSPIDSPQILIETVEFDVPLTREGTKVLLDSRFVKAVNHKFAVFVNNGEVIEKGDDYFVVAGEGLADCRIVGKRVGYEDVYFENLEN